MAGPSDNGGWSSDGGSPDDLPDLPEEWGVIVIPDDLSELSDEVDAVRAELRLAAPPTRWHRFARRPAMRKIRRFAATVVRAPVLIISLAVLVTVASLFASAWPGPPRPAATVRPTGPSDEHLDTLPALELFGSDGRPVPLNGRLPAVILIIDKCDDCADLVAGTIAAVDPAVAVITVAGPAAAVTVATTTGTPPTGATPQAQGKTVRELHDPSGSVRAQLKLAAADGTGAALLVDRVGKIVKEIRRTSAAAEVTPYLGQLTS
jgi:hypothetical protein